MDFKEVFNQIEAYHKDIGYNYTNTTLEERMQYFRNNALALSQEVAELVDSTPWKPWRFVGDQKFSVPNATREIIDCIFFLGAICEILDIRSKELEDMFKMVLKHNYTRIRKGYNNTKEDRL